MKNVGRRKKSKADRARDREIVLEYHRKMTEEALQPLYERFQEWKNGDLLYDDLTEYIHQFHKENQEIYKLFNMDGWDDEFLIFQAKKNLNRLNDADREKYQHWLEISKLSIFNK